MPARAFRAPPGNEARVPLKDYPELERPGGLIRVTTERQREIFVRAEEGGGYTALSAICTHQGGIVRPSPAGFRCPLHGSTYDREGQNTGGPARRPLARFPVERQGEFVVLRIGG